MLLSVPVDVLVQRLVSRYTNSFGKNSAERDRVLNDLAHVEPLLRSSATVELDTRRADGNPSLATVVKVSRALGLRLHFEAIA